LQIVGESAAICQLRERIAVAAACDEPVLIVGETGTGKELVARAVHARSRRAGKSLSIVNCAAVAPEMIAAELFGHVVGAFTGASYSRDGRLRAAAGSSIFLDEMASTSNEFQVALLRAVEYGEVQPVGADGPIRRVDVRYIAASSISLQRLRDGRTNLRQDLLYRFAGIVIEAPPLRDRQEDVPALARHFLNQTGEQYGRTKRLSTRAVDGLVQRDFPGNVRELRQTVRRAYATCDGDVIRPEHLCDPFGDLSADASQEGPDCSDDEPVSTLRSTTRRFALAPAIRRWLVRAIAEADGNLSEAARLLEIPRSTLQHHLVKYQINVDALRPGGAADPTAQAATTSGESTAPRSVSI
jgi:transcriptional regulator with GAF, ATPase, and Fis domain